MDESDGLENRCGRKVTVGSNPTSSAQATSVDGIVSVETSLTDGHDSGVLVTLVIRQVYGPPVAKANPVSVVQPTGAFGTTPF